jgi:hypothetical protein
MIENEIELSWWSKIFRSKAKLTYWLDNNVFVVEVCHFIEKSSECIIFKDYYSKKTVMVKHTRPITYVLEEIK